jgi:hypothetical protein
MANMQSVTLNKLSKQTPLHDVAPPHLALELRAFWEFGAVVPSWPALQKAPRAQARADGST